MNIIYISGALSEKKFSALFADSPNKPGQQVQKYNRLMLEGLAENDTIINAVCVLPVNSGNTPHKFFKEETEKSGNITYHYPLTVNLPIIKNICSYINTYLLCRKLSQEKDSVIMYDVLSASASAAALAAAKKGNIKTVALVTDMPEFLFTKKRNIDFINRVISKSASYVFLTKQMGERLNASSRPQVIIEGMVDSKIAYHDEPMTTQKKKVCIYAGGLEAKYGLDYLVDAFMSEALSDVELHLYGDGGYKDEIVKAAASFENIKYFGTVMNDIVVEAEKNASLLINPRYTANEYTGYSFPSKNMEYMVSATPVLTTNLPGMPEEYRNYVYIIGEETAENLVLTIKNLLDKPSEELISKGAEAKSFVLSEKNNIIQAGKVINMIKESV